MALGLPYDSDAGRAWAAAVTALMSGVAYDQSVELAAELGPFDGYARNAAPMRAVLEMHRDAAYKVGPLAPKEIIAAAQAMWDRVVDRSRLYRVRNSQVSVLAPTGTISFMMDCDTTGIEPDLGLVKWKQLVGGGTLQMVNGTVGRALSTLGYGDAEASAIVKPSRRPARPWTPQACWGGTSMCSLPLWATSVSHRRAI